MFSSKGSPEFSIIPPNISTSPYKPFRPSKKPVSTFGSLDAFDGSNAQAGPSRIRAQSGFETPLNLPDPFLTKLDPFTSNQHGVVDIQQSVEDAQILKRSKEQFGSYTCRIERCKAILGNYEILLKHVDKHLQKMHAHTYQEDIQDNDDDNFFSRRRPRYNCPWGTCKQDEHDIERLKRHIEVVHLAPELRCPFKGCNDKLYKPGYGISSISYHSQRHRIPWEESSFQPSFLNSYLPVNPSPPLPDIVLPAYMISHPPILPRGQIQPKSKTRTASPPYVPIPSIPRYIYEEDDFFIPSTPKSGKTGSNKSPPTFRKMEHPILPNRNDDTNPFFPLCGEAISYDSTGTFSGSIFPSTVPPEGDEDRERDSLGNFIVPSASEDGAVQLQIRKKLPNKIGKMGLGRPKLGVPADVFEWHRKQKEMRMKNQKLKDRKGKGKTTEISSDEKMDLGDLQVTAVIAEEKLKELKLNLKKCHPDSIRSSALRFASRKTGRSVGVDVWKEVIRFENEGRYWGEL
ncbi:hypothetical protein I203_107417 [Kwoniella mangroviensis CBS 8507]|uniref:hypothetical protein n=1 Tax=Kwoniella mangroviensis CBS 8507 TaxID=1296122 RepID=UPI003062BA88